MEILQQLIKLADGDLKKRLNTCHFEQGVDAEDVMKILSKNIPTKLEKKLWSKWLELNTLHWREMKRYNSLLMDYVSPPKGVEFYTKHLEDDISLQDTSQQSFINMFNNNYYKKMKEEIGIVIKPKPRWMPKFIYNSVIRNNVEIQIKK